MEEQKIDLDKVRRDEGRRGTSSHHRLHRKRKKKKILKGILIFLLVLLLTGVGTAAYMFHSGQEKITRKGQASRPQLQPVHTEEVQIDTEILDEDTIKYNGQKYKYKDDMINLLFLGVDTSGTGRHNHPCCSGQQSKKINADPCKQRHTYRYFHL